MFYDPVKPIRVVGKRLTSFMGMDNVPVICIHGPLGAGDTGDMAGLKCHNLTSDVSRQCRGCAGVLTSR